MARRADLREIGLEGFALIDQYYGPPPRRSMNGGRYHGVFPARQGHSVVQVPNAEMEVPSIDSQEAASRFGGIMIVNYPKRKPQNR